jgi:hypothetical protein
VYTEDVKVRNRLTYFTEMNPEAPLKLGFVLLLRMRKTNYRLAWAARYCRAAAQAAGVSPASR